MKCPICGKEIANGSMFCEYCGVQIKKNRKPLLITIFVIIVLLALGGFGYYQYDKAKQERAAMEREMAEAQQQLQQAQQKQQENNNKMLNDKESYLVLVKDGDALLANKKYSESISKYNEALVYEQKYSGTGYASHFNSNVETKISSAKQQQEYAQQKQQENNNKMLNDKESYLILVKDGDALLADKKYSESISKYNDALVYEQKYSGTGYASHFNSNVKAKISSAKQQQEENDKESYLVLVKDGDALLANKKYSESISKYNEALVYEQKYSGTGYASHFNSNVKAKISSAKQQQEYARTHGRSNGHDWVDLGLSVKWATCNVGASKPEYYGYYYAWGETSTKSSYEYKNSKTSGKSMWAIAGNSSYDAARAKWGGKWRLPTKSEMQELIDKCTWEWITQNGKNGYKVTGPNGNSIFLPAAGWHSSSLSSAGSGGYYWSSTPDEGRDDSAYYLYFSGDDRGMGCYFRSYGRSVRPVLE